MTDSFQLASPDASWALQDFITTCDVVIFELFGHEAAAMQSVAALGNAPYGGRCVHFLAISHPLTWGSTPRLLEAVEAQRMSASAQDRLPNGASDSAHQQRDSATPRPDAAEERPCDVTAAVCMQEVASSRVPSASAKQTYRAEQTILHSTRPGRLHTYVVCPGLLYGAGEDSANFFPWARQAWELQEGDAGQPAVLGSGDNLLPTLHVHDLARYLYSLCCAVAPRMMPALNSTAVSGAAVAAGSPGAAAASSRPGTASMAAASALLAAGLRDVLPVDQRYCLVADSSRCTQAEVAAAFSSALGRGGIRQLPLPNAAPPPTPHMLVNLAFATTPVPNPSPAFPYTSQYSAGPVAQIPSLANEFVQAHNLTPLRIVVMGPPMSGKSLVARRLAHQYALQYLNTADILALASAPSTPADLARTVQAELAGKEPRASASSLGGLLQALLRDPLGRSRTTVRGYVLDGFPKTLHQAYFAYGRVMALSAEEAAAVAAMEAEATGALAGGKDAKGKKDAKPATAAKASAKPGKDVGPGPEVFVIPVGSKVAPVEGICPTHVIELTCSDEERRSRLAAVAAMEAAAAQEVEMLAAAADTLGKGGKGAAAAKAGKKGSTAGPTSHNNDADFTRRSEAFRLAREEDAADCEARVKLVQAVRRLKAQAEEAAAAAAAAEAATLKARRKAAKLAAAAAAVNGSQGTQSDQQEAAGLPQGTGSTPAGAALPTPDALPAGSGQEPSAEPGVVPGAHSIGNSSAAADPVAQNLPEHGGMVGLFTDGRAKYLRLANPNVADMPFATGAIGVAPHLEAFVQMGVPEAVSVPHLDAALQDLLGQPHNFDGITPPPPAPAPPSPPALVDAGTTSYEGPPRLSAEDLAQLTEASATSAARVVDLHVPSLAQPHVQGLLSSVLPHMASTLVRLAHDQPLSVLEPLIRAALDGVAKEEGAWVDPYTHPSYQEQRDKHAAKQAREEARAQKAVAAGAPRP